MCYSSWGHKESDMTKRLNGSEPIIIIIFVDGYGQLADMMSFSLQILWCVVSKTRTLSSITAM